MSLLSLAAALTACQNKSSRRRSQFDAPALNQPRTVVLAKRSSLRTEPDNYQATCLFLNDSFRRMNTCTISLQSDFSIAAVQAGGQVAQVSRGSEGQTLEAASWPGEREGRDRLNSSDYKVGDVWFVRKSDRNTSYEIAFEVLSIDAASVTVRYEVKTFALK